ncbi:MAG: chorismate mutase [Candidatus Eiseniibacteriota bacterium]
MTTRKDGEPSVDGPALWDLPADTNAAPAKTLGEIRDNIDRIDQAVVALLAERLRYTRAAARFKADPREVAAPARVDEVIAKIRALAAECGLPPDIAEAAYRPLVAAYITDQQRLFERISAAPRR